MWDSNSCCCCCEALAVVLIQLFKWQPWSCDSPEGYIKTEAQGSAIKFNGQPATIARQTGCRSAGVWRTIVVNCYLSVPGCSAQLGNAVHWWPLHNAELRGWKCADLPMEVEIWLKTSYGLPDEISRHASCQPNSLLLTSRRAVSS